jgi:hypothetical protein
MLYQNGHFIARRKSEELYMREDVAQIEILQNNQETLVILRTSSFFDKK